MNSAACAQPSRLPFTMVLLAIPVMAALFPLAAGSTAGAWLPSVLCSVDARAGDSARPAASVKILRSEPLVGAPGKRITTLLVHFAPRAFSPRHVHGGDVTAYVLGGAVRSEHAGLAAMTYHAGETFHEPYGTTHEFIENPSASEPAEILAIVVHDEGAPLTTFVDR